MLFFTRHPRTYTNDYHELNDDQKSAFSHWNIKDSEITENGKIQALKASYEFKNWLETKRMTLDELVVSPSRRTLKYASIILSIIPVKKIIIDPVFREKVKNNDIGNIGLRRDQIENALNQYGLNGDINIDTSQIEKDWNAEIETDVEFSQRLDKAKIVFQNSQEKNSLIISHWLFGNLFLERPDRIDNCEFLSCKLQAGKIISETIIKGFEGDIYKSTQHLRKRRVI